MVKKRIKIDFFENWLQRCRQAALFREKQTILLAVSGGVDSMVLWNLFERASRPMQLQLVIAHLNHQLRGAESLADEALVRKRAEEKKIHCVSEQMDVKQFCKAEGKSLEAGARIVRYAFLNRVATEQGCDHIATGHNADDQAESVLLNLIRGCGITGLTGIDRKQQRLIRPLLDFSREQIYHYAQQFHIPWRFDKSNRDQRFTRNRVRHTLLPLLKSDFNPSVVSVLNSLSNNMRQAEDYLRQEAETAYQNCFRERDQNKIILDIEPFLMYFTFLQKYILDKALHQLVQGTDVAFDFKKFQLFLSLLKKRQSHKRIDIGSSFYLTATRSVVVVGRAPQPAEHEIITKLPARMQIWDDLLFTAGYTDKTLHQIARNADPDVAYADADKLEMPLTIRTPRPGDAFIPLGMKGHKKVSDFFIDAKIPFYLRDRVPILETSAGIVWICGHRLDDRFKVTSNTENIIKLTLSEDRHEQIRV